MKMRTNENDSESAKATAFAVQIALINHNSIKTSKINHSLYQQKIENKKTYEKKPVPCNNKLMIDIVGVMKGQPSCFGIAC